MLSILHYINDKDLIKSLATTLVTQYGDDAEAIAMLRAAEHAAELNNEEWIKWEQVVIEIKNIDNSPNLNG